MGREKTASTYSLVRVTLGQLTASEWIGVKSAAKAKGMSPTAFMRGAIFEAAKVTPVYERRSWDHARAKKS
jgi:hypothetical protein